MNPRLALSTLQSLARSLQDACCQHHQLPIAWQWQRDASAMYHVLFRMLILSTALAATATANADPNDPGNPQQTPSKYIVRQLSDNAELDDNHGEISGTNVAWFQRPAAGGSGDENILQYVPLVSDTAPVVIATSANPLEIGPGHHQISGNLVAWSDVQNNNGTSTQIFTKPAIGPPNLIDTTTITSDVRIGAGGNYLAWNTSVGITVTVNGAPHVIPNSSVGNGTLFKIAGDYVLHRQDTASGHELWAHNMLTQQDTLLTDPNYTWSMFNVIGQADIDGSVAAWSASYSDNGPQFEDEEIYSYDLSIGPASYTQVTQNDVDDWSPTVAGTRLAWTESQAINDDYYKIYLQDGNSTSLVGESGTNTTSGSGAYGMSASTVAWEKYDGSDWTIQAVTNGKPHTVWSPAGALDVHPGFLKLSGPNIAWTGHDGNDTELFAAYYIGPGAVLTGLDLSLEELSEFSLYNANLQFVDFRSALIEGTDFRGADFTGATNLQYAIGQAIYSHRTILPAGFDAQAAGWSYVTPEPSALLLALLGLGLLPQRRRRRR